jgi:intracellular sulfur oxidation DsrE/DsrF family protein
MTLETPGMAFIACANTEANMSKQEDKTVPLIGEAKVMPSGVVRIMELKQKGICLSQAIAKHRHYERPFRSKPSLP